jgi:hypothetical protein
VLRKSVFVVCLALLSGCNHEDDSNNSENLIRSTLATLSCPASQEGIGGCWVTENCGQMNDEDGNPIEYWGHMKVLFSQEGEIQILGEQFKNSSCTGQPNSTTEFNEIVVTYSEGQPELDVSGVYASQIIVTSTFGDKDPFNVGTLYYITDKYRLCLSENFNIGYSSVGVAQAGSTAIDFNSCLIRAG